MDELKELKEEGKGKEEGLKEEGKEEEGYELKEEGKGEEGLDELIRDLCNDYVDESLVSYFKTGFMQLAVEAIEEMLYIALDNEVKEEEKDEDAVSSMLDTVLEERGISRRAVPRFLFVPSKTLFVPSKTLFSPSKPLFIPSKPLFTPSSNTSEIQATIRRLDSIPDMIQRSSEWYAMRHSLLTATAIAHLFTTQAKTNEVIYEKCQPVQPMHPISVLDARHWGVKYEPVTRAIYETIYKTKVKEYGCIQHRAYPFIGASPDGINILQKNGKQYGRLVEIKNVVSRIITGDPLDDYWIQMQIQMEVCDLDVCDFVETHIKEFASPELFYAERDKYEFCGAALHFTSLLDPNVNFYEYLPLPLGHFITGKQVASFSKKAANKFRHSYKLNKVLYWYLEEFSCVVVERNKPWFSVALPRIEAVWNTIEEERKSGAWTLRAPNKRRRQDDDVRSIVLNPVSDFKASGFLLLNKSENCENVCLL